MSRFPLMSLYGTPSPSAEVGPVRHSGFGGGCRAFGQMTSRVLAASASQTQPALPNRQRVFKTRRERDGAAVRALSASWPAWR